MSPSTNRSASRTSLTKTTATKRPNWSRRSSKVAKNRVNGSAYVSAVDGYTLALDVEGNGIMNDDVSVKTKWRMTIVDRKTFGLTDAGKTGDTNQPGIYRFCMASDTS